MQLVIKNGKVHAWHNDGQDIQKSYPVTEFEIVQWDEPITASAGTTNDPRTEERKLYDRSRQYISQRVAKYPSVRGCLEMIFCDMRDGTHKYVDAIQKVHDAFPDPTAMGE